MILDLFYNTVKKSMHHSANLLNLGIYTLQCKGSWLYSLRVFKVLAVAYSSAVAASSTKKCNSPGTGFIICDG